MYGTGFFPTDRAQVYETVDGDCLVGTSEVPLAAMHMEEFLDEGTFPIRYAGYSTCFRREAGAAGRDTRGILRVHQFDKVEMFSFCAPEQSAAEHQVILSPRRAILQGLGIPYQVVNIAAGDLGAPRRRSSTARRGSRASSATGAHQLQQLHDYQARRLNTRFRTEKGPRFVHTLNAPAWPSAARSSPSWRTASRPTAASRCRRCCGRRWARTSSAPEYLLVLARAT